LTFEVSDGELKDQETIVIAITAAGSSNNRPPVLEPLGDQLLEVGQPFDLRLVATDPNGDLLTFSMEGAPQDALLDEQRGIFSWIPSEANGGQRYEINFRVSDGELQAEMLIALIVRDSGSSTPDNLPPEIRSIPDQELQVGEEKILVIEASDDHPESLIYSIVPPSPQGSTFDAASHTFRWTPSPEQADQAFAVIFQVTDGEFRVVQRVSFQVLPLQQPPPECQPDELEAQEPISLEAETSFIGANICPTDDEDRYLIQIEENFYIDLQASFSGGDLDLELLDPIGVSIGALGTGEDESRLRVLAPQSGEYTLIASAWEGTPEYGLEFSLERAAPCEPDPFEPNELEEQARDLRTALGQDLQICAGDLDLFFLEALADTEIDLQVEFSHAQGDLDAILAGPNNYNERSSSSDDNEHFTLTLPSDGRYLLTIIGYDSAIAPYRLSLEETPPEPPPPCEPDRLENNDSLFTAETLIPELYRNLNDCGDQDWYKTMVPQGQELWVMVSADGFPPALLAYHFSGESIEEQSYDHPDLSECQPSREGCGRLRVPGQGEDVYYRVQGELGQVYDLDVELH